MNDEKKNNNEKRVLSDLYKDEVNYLEDETSSDVEAIEVEKYSVDPGENPVVEHNATNEQGPMVAEGSNKVEALEEVSKVQRRRFSFSQLVVLLLIVSLVGGGSIGLGIGYMTNVKAASVSDIVNLENENYLAQEVLAVAASGHKSIVEIANLVGPSVVAITSQVTVKELYQTYNSEGQGSGVIFSVSDDGILILTNNHVVDKAKKVSVEVNNGAILNANLVGSDPDSDLAVIKIDKSELTEEILLAIRPIAMGDSDKLLVGEMAIAMGNPLGYGKTLTAGVISALNRELTVSRNEFSLIQTDAAINPGNSGGALVNSKGELIGINTIKISDTNVEGIGFAIPINTAKPIIKELLEKGYVSKPYLGIYGKDIDQQISEIYKLPVGVIIMGVIEGSSAHDAGIRKGDIIISFGGDKIGSMEQLVTKVKTYSAGDDIPLTVVREGNEKIEVSVKLKEKQVDESVKF